MKGLAIRAFMAGVSLYLMTPPASAQMPPAGTMIVNQAQSDYIDGASPGWSLSNAVGVRVLPVYSIALTPPGSVASPAYTLTGAGGDTLYCAFDLTNAGNSRDSVAVGYGVIPPSNTNIAGAIFFDDRNGNGRFDPGENDPGLLAIDAGGTVRMDVGVVLPPGAFGGDAYVEIRAGSTSDTTGTVEASVIRVTNTDPQAITIHLGPRGNPRALPGGEGSGDDLTVGYVDNTSMSFTFFNDVLNESTTPDFYEIALDDSVPPPPLISVVFADSAGQQLPLSPASSTAYLLGVVGPGETVPIRVVVSSASGALAGALPGPLSLRLRARSLADTLQCNNTVDRLVPPQTVDPVATLSIDQAFHQHTATLGDVVTLLVTTRNITDSVRVDSVVVYESAQPQLDFVSSPDFDWERGRLIWRAGSLAGGQSRTAVIKYVANSRVYSGTARAFGRVTGVAQTGDAVWAGPAVSTIRLENGPFVGEAVVLGEVYVDENDNRRRDAGEGGVPDVAVYLDSGEYAVTDSLGRFSLPRAFAGWRAVRLDESTLPHDLQFFVPLASRDAGRRENEQIIHVLPGGNANVSFRLKRIPPPATGVEHALTYHEQVSVTPYARLYKAFVAPSAYFGLGRAHLTIDSAEELRPVVEFLHTHRDWGVFLEGHTDSIPISTAEFHSNYELSLARADAIRYHLVSMGVDRDRIVVRGYGETRPLATNETVEGRRLNRRVEMSLIPPGVSLDDGELQRVSATIKDLSTLPDTFKVHVRWEIHTTSDRPCNAKIRVELPHQFRSADVRVTLDGEPIFPEDGAYVLPGFARSKEVKCEVELRASGVDTARVADIEAQFEVDDPQTGRSPRVSSDALAAPVASSTPLGPPRGRFRIRPYEHGRSDGRESNELFSWSEAVTPLQSVRTAQSGATTSGADVAQSGIAPPGNGFETFAIVEPKDGDVFTRADQIKIRARVPLGGLTEVFVRGERVAEGHLGRKSIHVKEGYEEITWFAVRIHPGWNAVTLRSTALNGVVQTDSVLVALAARPASLESQRKRILIPADGKTGAAVRFAVRDERGLAVGDGFIATVVEGDSLVADADARPDLPGLQVSSYEGYFELHVKPDSETRRRTIGLECEGMRASCEVGYVSAARPVMAAGVVDLRFGSFETGGNGSKEGLDRVAGASEDGARADAEARLFVQSALPYGASLTARLDTEKREEEPLLKQINPEAQYPIYGDASKLHFAAPTRTGNYVSVDKGESSLRYGDFRTPFTGGRYLYYHQVATGVTGSLVGDDGVVRAFVTDTDFATIRDEFRADGTSGFYYLTRAPILENSERLFLETRRRYQQEVILDFKPLVRNRDYTINPFDGSILFKEPVPVTDRHFNPIFVVAIYEVRTEDASNYLFGMRGDLVRDRRYKVGGTAIANSGEGSGYALYGADGNIDVAGVTLGGEFARSEDEVLGDGNAYVVEAGVNNRITDTKLYYRRVGSDFHNPSFLGGAQEIGTRKAGLKSRFWLGGGGLSLLADGYVHDLRESGEDNTSLLAGVDFQHQLFQLFAGGRAARDKTGDDEHDGILSVVGVSVDSPGRTELRTRWEQNLGGEIARDYPNRLQALFTLPFGQRLRLTASYEYLGASGRPGTSQFQGGVESRVAPRTTAYTRYSMNRTASADRMGAIAGLRQAFRLGQNVTGTLALESFHSMAESEDDEYVSVKTGIATRRADAYVVEGRYEYRWQQVRSKHLVQLVASAQLRNGLSLLLSDAVAFAPDRMSENGLHYRGKLGLAYRPVGVPLQALFALKNYYERYTPVDPDGISWRLVSSADINYLPAVDHEVRLKYAYKRTEDFSYGVSVETDADLLLGQYVYRFARYWDVDLWGRVLAQRHGTTETGTGVEVGRLFFRMVRVAAGYSAGGFEDPDISGTDAWARGFGVRVQLILSDWVLNEFGGM